MRDWLICVRSYEKFYNNVVWFSMRCWVRGQRLLTHSLYMVSLYMFSNGIIQKYSYRTCFYVGSIFKMRHREITATIYTLKNAIHAITVFILFWSAIVKPGNPLIVIKGVDMAWKRKNP